MSDEDYGISDVQVHKESNGLGQQVHFVLDGYRLVAHVPGNGPSLAPVEAFKKRINAARAEAQASLRELVKSAVAEALAEREVQHVESEDSSKALKGRVRKASDDRGA